MNKHKAEVTACNEHIKVLGEHLFANIPPPKGLSEKEIDAVLKEPPALTRYVVDVRITAYPLVVTLIGELSVLRNARPSYLNSPCQTFLT